MPCICGAGACSTGISSSEVKRVVKECLDEHKCPPPTMTIDDLSLEVVVEQFVKKGWPAERAIQARAEYREFLRQFQAAASESPDLSKMEPMVPPSQDVDDFWHQHVLNTKKYALDCKNVLGFFLHHDPSTFQEPRATK